MWALHDRGKLEKEAGSVGHPVESMGRRGQVTGEERMRNCGAALSGDERSSRRAGGLRKDSMEKDRSDG
jgi:hypothetical protein